MKFDYSINFHKQLLFSVGNTKMGKPTSAAQSCWEGLQIIKNPLSAV